MQMLFMANSTEACVCNVGVDQLAAHKAVVAVQMLLHST